MNWNRLNRDYYGDVLVQLQRLGVSEGQAYTTTPETKVHIPQFSGCYGLNVLNPENEATTKRYRAMLSVRPLADRLVARYFATGEESSKKFVRPGVVDKLGGAVIVELVEPDTYDGYQITATDSGLVTVEGILPERAGLEELPAFDEHTYSANTFLQTVKLALNRRERQ